MPRCPPQPFMYHASVQRRQVVLGLVCSLDHLKLDWEVGGQSDRLRYLCLAQKIPHSRTKRWSSGSYNNLLPLQFTSMAKAPITEGREEMQNASNNHTSSATIAVICVVLVIVLWYASKLAAWIPQG